MGVDGTRGVAVDLAVHRQVTVAGHANPVGGGNGVVVDGLAVGICGQKLGEYAAPGGPVPLLGPDVFRS